jgi:hypothetical protein
MSQTHYWLFRLDFADLVAVVRKRKVAFRAGQNHFRAIGEVTRFVWLVVWYESELHAAPFACNSEIPFAYDPFD